eukprot:1933647-Amphidinium_carterae.1
MWLARLVWAVRGILVGKSVGSYPAIDTLPGTVGMEVVSPPIRGRWVLEVPLSFGKVKGGTDATWTGYEIDLSGFTVGVSETKASWVSEWPTPSSTRSAQ